MPRDLIYLFNYLLKDNMLNDLNPLVKKIYKNPRHKMLRNNYGFSMIFSMICISGSAGGNALRRANSSSRLTEIVLYFSVSILISWPFFSFNLRTSSISSYLTLTSLWFLSEISHSAFHLFFS